MCVCVRKREREQERERERKRERERENKELGIFWYGRGVEIHQYKTCLSACSFFIDGNKTP